MPRLEWGEQALRSLAQLIVAHQLPADTRARVETSAEPLARFPRLGPEISKLEDGSELRFLIGPWPWLLVIYLYLEDEDRIGIVSLEDGRSATSTLATQRPRP